MSGSTPFARTVNGCRRSVVSLLCAVALLGLPAGAADEVLMQNGDRYSGRILSLNSNVLVLQSETLGQVKLPRSEVAGLSLNTPNARAAAKAASTAKRPGSTNDLDSVFIQLGRSTNLVNDVQKGLLSDANPEATRQFNSMVKGLLTGRLSVEDIRAQAATTASQLREIRGELGEEAGAVLDGYLKILEDFVNRGTARTNSAALPRQ